MSKGVKEWARRARYKLVYELGGKCVNPECGEEEYEKLTFDHIDGKDWETTGLSTDQRMVLYRREAKLGLLQILCLVCNSRKGDPRMAPERERCRLLINIGNMCATPDCEINLITDLHFVHVHGIDWEPPNLEYEARLALYKAEMEAGRMTMLCDACIAAAGLEPTDIPIGREANLSAVVPF